MLDPLASGLRRRAQSLNFAIRTNQSSVDTIRQNLSTSSSVKRQRTESPVDSILSHRIVLKETKLYNKIWIS